MASSTSFCKQLNNFLTALVIISCVVLLIMEMNLPNLKLNKSNLLINVVRHLQEKNFQNRSLNYTDKYYLSLMESNAAGWFLKYFTIEKIDSLGVIAKLEEKSKEAANLLQPRYNQICIEILRNKTKLLNEESYKGYDPALKVRAIERMNKSIPLMCSFLVGDLHNIFPSKELGLYFSVVIMNTLMPQIDGSLDKIIPTMRNLTTDRSNNNLAAVIAINTEISIEIYTRLRRCKTNILYRPHDCFTAVDFDRFNKSYINSTFLIDYADLDSYFFDRWTTFRIVGNYPVLEPTDLTTETITEHFMFRGDIVITEETNMEVIRKMMQGVSLAKEYIKDRCSEVNMFTVRCRRKNLVSVTVPCLYDHRYNETADFIDCTVPIMIIYQKDKPKFNGTIFENIGKEINGYPNFIGKSFFWSFFDPQIPEISPL